MVSILDDIIVKHQQGLLVVYTGSGEEATMAALGQAMRFMGHDKRVCVLKCPAEGETDEESIACLSSLLTVKRCEAGRERHSSDGEDAGRCDILQEAARIVATGDFELLILAGVLCRVAAGSPQEERVLALGKALKSGPCRVDVILTGSSATEAILAAADTLSIFSRRVPEHSPSA